MLPKRYGSSMLTGFRCLVFQRNRKIWFCVYICLLFVICQYCLIFVSLKSVTGVNFDQYCRIHRFFYRMSVNFLCHFYFLHFTFPINRGNMEVCSRDHNHVAAFAIAKFINGMSLNASPYNSC